MWCDSRLEGILKLSPFSLLYSPAKLMLHDLLFFGTSRQFYLYPWLQTYSQICSAQNFLLNADLYLCWLLGTPPSCFIGTSRLIRTNLKSSSLQICTLPDLLPFLYFLTQETVPVSYLNFSSISSLTSPPYAISCKDLSVQAWVVPLTPSYLFSPMLP